MLNTGCHKAEGPHALLALPHPSTSGLRLYEYSICPSPDASNKGCSMGVSQGRRPPRCPRAPFPPGKSRS